MDDYGNTTYDYWDEGETANESQSVARSSWDIASITIFSIITIVGLPANIAVVVMILVKQRLRNITNVYLLNRSLVDILLLVCFPLMIYYITAAGFGPPGCYIIISIGTFHPLSSSVFLVLLAVDCFMMSRPQHNTLQYRWKVLKVGLGVTWASSVPLCVLLYFTSFNGECTGFLTSHDAGIVMYSTYFLMVVPKITLWILVSFLYPPKGKPTPNTETAEEGQAVLSLRRFILILAIVNTVLIIPLSLKNMLATIVSIPFEITMIVYYLLDLTLFINPILYIVLRKDLKLTLTNCLSPQYSDSLALNTL